MWRFRVMTACLLALLAVLPGLAQEATIPAALPTTPVVSPATLLAENNTAPQCTTAGTHPVSLGLIGAGHRQLNTVLCVPVAGYWGSPHYLAHLLSEQLAGGMTQVALDGLQVMLLYEGTAAAGHTLDCRVGKAKTHKQPYHPQVNIHRLSTDWAWFDVPSWLANRRLASRPPCNNLQAVYVTVDGVTDSALLALWQRFLNSIGGSGAALLGIGAAAGS